MNIVCHLGRALRMEDALHTALDARKHAQSGTIAEFDAGHQRGPKGEL